MTRLEAGAVNVKRDLVDAGDAVRERRGAREKQLSRPRDRGHDPAHLPLVRADATLLEQVLFNLLDNAEQIRAGGFADLRVGPGGGARSSSSRSPIAARASRKPSSSASSRSSIVSRLATAGLPARGLACRSVAASSAPWTAASARKARSAMPSGRASSSSFPSPTSGRTAWPRERGSALSTSTVVLVVDDEPQISAVSQAEPRGCRIQAAHGRDRRRGAQAHRDARARRRRARSRPAGYGRQGRDQGRARMVAGADHRAFGARPRGRKDRRARSRRRRLREQALRHRRADGAHPHAPAPPQPRGRRDDRVRVRGARRRHARPHRDTQRRGVAAHAEGIRRAPSPGAQRRTRDDASTDPASRVGAGQCRGHAISARLRRPVCDRRSRPTPPSRSSSSPSPASAIASRRCRIEGRGLECAFRPWSARRTPCSRSSIRHPSRRARRNPCSACRANSPPRDAPSRLFPNARS